MHCPHKEFAGVFAAPSDVGDGATDILVTKNVVSSAHCESALAAAEKYGVLEIRLPYSA